ncbi:MAG TPA: MMPL family transporter [Mycobacterium sp.]
MLHAIAGLASRAPRRIIAAALLIMVAAAIYGVPVTNSLSNGGFRDPTSQSWRASELLSGKFDTGDMQMVVAVTSQTGVHGAAADAAGRDIVARLQASPYVAQVQSAWTAPAAAAPALVSADGKTGLIVAGITGGDSAAQAHAKELSEQLPAFTGVTVKFGGEAMSYVQIVEQTMKDLQVMEAIALPVSFVVLVWVFGGLLAAALPLAVGVFAILGSMAVMRLLAAVTEVSIFALNLILALGLALAIDYTLLIVSRFRDEVARGISRDEALLRTMATAGRTVLFSAVTVALSMVSMMFFPMPFLKSFAYAGVAAVAFAALAAVVVTPAALALLGQRLDSWDVRRLARRLLGRAEPQSRPVDQRFFYRLAKAVMRRPIPIGLAIVGLLLVLGAPFLGIKWGYLDDRVLPQSATARQLGDQMRNDFDVNALTDVTVVVPDMTGLTPAELGDYAAELSRIPDVTAVSSPGGTYADGVHVGPPTAATGLNDGSAFLTVNSTAPLYSQASETQLDRLHAVTPPAGRETMFAGAAQINRDTAQAVSSRLPFVLALIGIVTFVLMFLLTGSVVLPLKTLVLNMLSLSAAFGALVWIFQDGHLGGLGTTTTGTLVASVPVLLFCLAFGLSMDYEVFLISRIREYWEESGKTDADNEESVAKGLAHTGRVVTAAALLMAITFASLIAANVSVMRVFGLGVPLAVLMDATLVRMLLVPAFMKVLGRVNWWAPAPLARLHRHIGISDSPAAPKHPVPVGHSVGRVPAEAV